VVHGFSRAGRVSGLLALVLTLAAAAPAAASEAQPTANFTVPSPVVAGAPATFTSTSEPTPQHEITASEWSFGDATPGASGATVEHTFASPGTMTVTLKVTDGTGDASVSKQVTVLPPPVASFIYTPVPPVAGRPASFASTASAVPGYSITSISWDFDADGFFEAGGANVQHTFASGGRHVVRLRVSDSSGVSAELVQPIAVNAPPDVSFAFSPSEPQAGQQVTLTSTSEDTEGPLVEQAWDLDGDGDFNDASGASVRGMFTSAGRHSVALRVTDADGASSTQVRVITVRVPDSPGTVAGNAPGATPPGPFLRLMTPFPVVRLAGEVVRNGARIQMLSVRAPAGAQVVVRCSGARCPDRQLTKLSGRRPVRFGKLERFLPAGTSLAVLVRRAGQIGKYTRFQIRNGRVPKRTDGCLFPGTSAGARCPAT
jgi:PKD repeat protein